MLIALASATAIAILMPAGPDDGCPSPRQVSEALTAHLPGMVQPLGRAAGANVLRLSVTSDGAGALRVDLSDPDGGPLLRRRVAPETGPRAKAGDCAALAETAALIVDRYWHEVGYEVPPAPPPAPPKPPPAPPPPAPPAPEKPVAASAPPVAAPVRAAATAPPRAPEPPPQPLRPPAWWIAAGFGVQAGDRGSAQLQGSLAFAVERARWAQRVGLRFSVGGRYRHPAWPNGNAAVVQVPVAMDAYLAFRVGLGRLEPGMGVDLNVISVTAYQGSAPESRLAAAPAVDALIAWTVPTARDFFIRFVGLGAVGVPVRILDDTAHHVITDTPRFRGELGLELGVWFH